MADDYLSTLDDAALADEGRYLIKAYLNARSRRAEESLQLRVQAISDEKARRVFARAREQKEA